MQEIEQKIQQDLQQKIKREQQKLQDQEKQKIKDFIIQQHEKVKDDLDWLDIPDELHELRDLALEQSKAEGYEQYQQRYVLDAQTYGYLHSKHINYQFYEQCFGTALQQQYHQEVCDLFKQLAHQELQLKRKAYLFDHACNFAQATHEANNKIWLSVAGVVSWTAQQLFAAGKDIFERPLEYAQAIASGVYESAIDSVHMLLRPDLALYGLGQIIYFVLETGAMTEAAASYPCKATKQVYQQRIDQIHTTLSALQKEFTNLDGPDKVKAITKFGSEFYLPPKIIHACGHFLSGLCTRARGARTLEGAVAIMSDEFGLAEIAEEIAVRAEQLESVVEQGISKKATAEFMQAEKQIARVAGYKIFSWEKVLEKVRCYKGKVPCHEIELIENIKYHLNKIVKQANVKISKRVKKNYNKIEKKLNNRKIDLRSDIDHIANFEYEIKDLNNGFKEIKLKGGHLAGSTKELEKAGLIVIKEEKLLPYGCKDFIAEDVFSGKKITKTEFPKHWDLDTIMEKISEAFDSLGDFEIEYNTKRIRHKGITTEGLKIQLVLDICDDYMKLVTAHPC